MQPPVACCVQFAQYRAITALNSTNPCAVVMETHRMYCVCVCVYVLLQICNWMINRILKAPGSFWSCIETSHSWSSSPYVYVDQTLVTDSNEQTPQSVRLLNQAAAHLKTAVKYCLCARRTAGWLAGVKKVLQSTSSMEILRGFRQLLAVVLHVALYYTWLCMTRGSVWRSAFAVEFLRRCESWGSLSCAAEDAGLVECDAVSTVNPTAGWKGCSAVTFRAQHSLEAPVVICQSTRRKV